MHFLPPDLNPIEEAFSKVKSYLKANDATIQTVSDDELQDFILAGFASINIQDCDQWIKYAGYKRVVQVCHQLSWDFSESFKSCDKGYGSLSIGDSKPPSWVVPGTRDSGIWDGVTVATVPCPRDWWNIPGRWLLSHPAQYPQIPLSFLSLVPGTSRMSWDGGYSPTLPDTHCPSCPLSRDWWDIPEMVATVPPCLGIYAFWDSFMISYWNHAPGYETRSLSYVGGDCLLAPHLLLYMANEAFSNFVFLLLCYMYQYLIIVFIEACM